MNIFENQLVRKRIKTLSKVYISSLREGYRDDEIRIILVNNIQVQRSAFSGRFLLGSTLDGLSLVDQKNVVNQVIPSTFDVSIPELIVKIAEFEQPIRDDADIIDEVARGNSHNKQLIKICEKEVSNLRMQL